MKRFSVIAASLMVIGCAGSGSGWETLVDEHGQGMDNFTHAGSDRANWQVKDGTLMADRGGKTPSYLVSKKSYGDFQIRAEFWASHDSNSGIFIRCFDAHKIGSNECYEVNIFDTRPDPTYGTGAIVDVAKVVPMPKAGGKWNTYEITAKGPHLVVIFNGVKTVDTYHTRNSYGPVALQWGSGTIKFRKVEIQEL